MTWFTPRLAIIITLFLSLVLVVQVTYRATHRVEARIDPCALVQERNTFPRCL